MMVTDHVVGQVPFFILRTVSCTIVIKNRIMKALQGCAGLIVSTSFFLMMSYQPMRRTVLGMFNVRRFFSFTDSFRMFSKGPLSPPLRAKRTLQRCTSEVFKKLGSLRPEKSHLVLYFRAFFGRLISVVDCTSLYSSKHHFKKTLSE